MPCSEHEGDVPDDEGALADVSDQQIATLTSYLATNPMQPDDLR